MSAHDRWERRSNRIDSALRRGRITQKQAIRAHVRNDRDFDDALSVAEKTARGFALADSPAEALAAGRY